MISLIFSGEAPKAERKGHRYSGPFVKANGGKLTFFERCLRVDREPGMLGFWNGLIRVVISNFCSFFST